MTGTASSGEAAIATLKLITTLGTSGSSTFNSTPAQLSYDAVLEVLQDRNKFP